MRLAPRPFFALCVLVFIAAAAFSALAAAACRQRGCHELFH